MPLVSSCPAPPHPLTLEEFSALMTAFDPFSPGETLAVATSGGLDSLCLTLLLKEWAQSRNLKIHALTVDHGLRPEAAAEARQVAQWMSASGVPHDILRWEGEKPATRIQEKAREARYNLLTAWCQQKGVASLFLGHHADDQAETFLLRLIGGSGVEGLAGMAGRVDRSGVRLMRPLLSVPKGRLQEALEARGQAWVEDPSNQNTHYARTRVRKILTDLRAEGLSTQRMSGVMADLSHVRFQLETLMNQSLLTCVQLFPEGYASLNLKLFRALSDAMAFRVLRRLLTCIGGHHYPLRSERVRGLLKALRLGKTMRMRTCGGCCVVEHADHLIVFREPAAVTASLFLEPGQTSRWDGRFQVSLKETASIKGPLEVRKLGKDGWRDLKKIQPDQELKALRILSPRYRETLPALWRDGHICAVPGEIFQGIFTPATPLLIS